MEGGPNIQERDSTPLVSENDEENEVKGCFSFFCHPRGSGHRFIALIFMCFLGFGSYFCYDNPAALQGHITKDLNISILQCNMFYSFYSWPNVILCFIGGFLIDRVFGIRLGTNIYMAITLIGQIVFALGVYCNQFWLMLCGRFIFGIGGESLAVAQNNYAVLWFKGKELNMVFGLQLSFARVGSTANFLVMESIYNWVHQSYTGPQGLGIVFFIATSTCVLSMFCALILGVLDKRAERILRRNEEVSGDVVRLTDVKDFKATFWLVTVICVTYYVAIFPFIFLAQGFFTEKFKMTQQAANNISGIVYLISGIASPLLGLFIDKTGKNLSWIVVAVIFTIGSHVLLAFTMVNPYVAMVMMGLAYSTLASSLWPLVSLIIPEYQLGTAYGVCQAIQNLGLAVVSIVTGIIVHQLGYNALEIFFISSLAGALCFTILLWILDKYRKGLLNMTPADRLRHQQSQLAAEVLEREKILSAASSSSTTDLLQPNSDFHIRNSSPPVTI
ncbi:major facilitator superfamily domain-containing protein 1 isoform X2 [Anoplophora glabripennis]|uniref:major facilitator superfamily domain-containing protein 1 isoform X2 n=1 Tax=Anoplophora glabripennis TaxID=217634 RepID=UPI00087542BA|nr:major facilitator superfamily domain-containing protein 1 isoform X2 [Anoplophora glabripennis]